MSQAMVQEQKFGAASLFRAAKLVYRAGPVLVIALVALSVFGGTLAGAGVAAIGWLVSAAALAIAGASWTPVLQAVAVLAGIQLLSKLAGALNQYCNALLTDRVTNSFSMMIATKASTLELADFENPEAYDQLQIANREAAFRPFQILSGAIGAVQNLSALVSVFLVVAQWSWLVAIIVLISPVADVIALSVFNRKLWQVEVGRTNRRRMGQYLVSLLTTDRSFKEIKSLGLASLLLGRYRDQLTDFYQVDKRLQGKLLGVTFLTTFLEIIFYGGAVLLAVQNTLESGDIGRLSGYISGLAAVSGSASSLLAGLATLYQNSLFISTVFSFLDRPGTRISGGEKRVPPALRSGISFRGVSLTYPGRTVPALDDIDLDIPAGSTVALVGENGAGKTTLVKLIARLYEPSAGRILFDGVPVEEYDIDNLRKSVAVLYQDFNRYELPVRDTVGFGAIAMHDDDRRIWEALDQVGMKDVISGYPDQLEQQLGRFFDGGIQPSGGQWQRLGIARTIMGDTPVQILDEPTASLDPLGEQAIFDLLMKKSPITRILISHKFSTVRHADLIYVMDDGRIIERGDHDHLMAYDGLYAEMFRKQASGYATAFPML